MSIDRLIAYCGVTCAPCPDYTQGKCPGCRETEWGDDPCMPVRGCSEKGIGICDACDAFPCADMAEYYQESEGHKEVYQRMLAMRKE